MKQFITIWCGVTVLVFSVAGILCGSVAAGRYVADAYNSPLAGTTVAGLIVLTLIISPIVAFFLVVDA